MKKQSVIVAAILCIGSLCLNYAWAKPTIEQLIATPQLSGVKISPHGKYLGIKVFDGEQQVLQFYDRETLKPVGGFGIGGRVEVGEFEWANEERIVGEVVEPDFAKAQPIFYGELFATDIDGTRSEMLFGFRSGESQTGTHLQTKDADYASAKIIDPLPDDDRHVLISKTEWSERHDRPARVELLDVYSGQERSQSISSKYGSGGFLTDSTGKVRVAVSFDAERNMHVQTLPRVDGEWIDLPRSAYGEHFAPF
ncbi:MAG: hypothetical protein KDI19_01620, partial [Pseudomonadales bacterium]|nr:hypothetical protein [Pseudomonadales bacterium]